MSDECRYLRDVLDVFSKSHLINLKGSNSSEYLVVVEPMEQCVNLPSCALYMTSSHRGQETEAGCLTVPSANCDLE